MQNEANSLLKGWVKTARDEFEVYTILKEKNPDYRVLFRQKYNSLCLTIELSLKAFLLLNGHTVRDLKRIGHDLIKLLDIADKEHGLKIMPVVYQSIKLLNPVYKSRQLLYFENTYTLPSNIIYIETTARLLLSKITFDSQRVNTNN